MARPKITRRICDPPKMQGFKPFGIPVCKAEPIVLKLEEYESFRLVNYTHLTQYQAAVKMNISRPTFTRIYNRALKLIATSFSEGMAILIEGGDFELDKEWYRCRKCFKLVQGIENHVQCENCPSYCDKELTRIN
jgi:uncharacterized protein